jgi:DNA helicase-2/ATP-dependent DNA helicase PcrA
MASVYTAQQQQVIDAGPGLVRVVSGAGTGKTTALVQRIIRLMKDGVDPNNILALSFTKAAAQEVKIRIGKELPDVKFKRASTIHSEANRIFRLYSGKIGMEGNKWQIVDSSDTSSLLKECVENILGELEVKEQIAGLTIDRLGYDPKNKEHMSELRGFVRDRINNWKERGFFIEQLEDSMAANEKMVTPSHVFAMLVYGRFQDRLHAQKLVEISDLIPASIKILEENPDICQKISRANVYVLVDEFQDVNKSQIRFIRALASHFNNLTIVGDDDQSMYMFRGSMPNAMRYAHVLLPGPAAKGLTDIVLTQNWRSPDEILQVGNLMVDVNPRDSMKVLVSPRKGAYPKVDSFDNEHSEANVLATRVKAQLLAGTPANEICVLSRLTRGLAVVNKVFLSRNIPHKMVSGGSFIERQEVRDILSWVRLALNPVSEVHFDRAAGSPPRGMGERAIALIIREAQTQKIDCISALQRAIDHRILAGKALAGAKEMLDILTDIQIMFEQRIPPKAILQSVIDRSQYMAWVAGGVVEPAEIIAPQSDMFTAPSSKSKKPLKKTGAEVSKDKKTLEKVEKVKESLFTLLEMATNATDMMNWMDDLTLADEISTGENKAPAVQVSTIHAAKGLEFDHVHLIGMYQGCLPFNQKESDPGIFAGMDNPWSDPLDGCLEEERRLAHVAITRAKKTVSISYPEVSYQKVNRVSELIELMRQHIPAMAKKIRDRDDGDFSDAFRQTSGTMRR